MKEFQYLGYTLRTNNSDKAHIQEMVRKAIKVIGIILGIGERKFGDDCKSRMMMFDSLIKSWNLGMEGIWRNRESARKKLKIDIGIETRNKKGDNESGSG